MVFEKNAKRHVTIPIVYVDDTVISNNDKADVKNPKMSQKRIGNKRSSRAIYFLDPKSKKGIMITQWKYELDMLEETRK